MKHTFTSSSVASLKAMKLRYDLNFKVARISYLFHTVYIRFAELARSCDRSKSN